MHLKKIESYGFKSFAHRTTIEFEEGMNAIVGPNGSGKSNVVDATRWVLGEQSAKTLRGGNMQDIIFKGSSTKKQLGFAEVTLVLDNEDRTLALDFAEVSVTRRLYRNGDSLYMINNQKVRLQDVVNLFMDSGIGKESFSIIGQGRIDEILNSKPFDRRAIFEEAAGVLKYKTRKEQSLRRLERTHENLQRVEDIMNELQFQIKPLQEQAETAKQYISYKEQLSSLEIGLLTHEIKTLKLEFSELQETMDQQVIKMGQQTIAVEQGLQAIEKVEIVIKQTDEAIETLQSKLLLVTEQVENAKGTRQLQQQKTEHLSTRQTEVENELKLLQEKLQQIATLEQKSTHVNFAKQLAEIKQKQDQLQSELDTKLQQSEQAQHQKQHILGEHKSVSSRYETLQELADSHKNLFHGVRSVIVRSEQQKLNGIEGTIVDLIEVADDYAKAIETALGNSLQFIITHTQQDAQVAIEYLKKNKLGKATFLPMDVMKGKAMAPQQLVNILDMKGVIGLAHTLIRHDQKYEQIFLQLLGQTIITENLAVANALAKQTQFKFRIVTLLGEVVHRGGSITGGVGKHETAGLLSQKKEIKQLKVEVSSLEEQIKLAETAYITISSHIQQLRDKVEQQQQLYYQNEHKAELFKQQLQQIEVQKQEIKEQYTRLEQRKVDIANELRQLTNTAEALQDTHEKHDQLKEQILLQINTTRSERLQLDTKRLQFLAEQKALEIEQKQDEKQYQQLELQKATVEIKATDKITRLQENYQCSYQSVQDQQLQGVYEELKQTVHTLRSALDQMGLVNLGAIEEYDRVSERFEHLHEQHTDLIEAENNLLTVIAEMDDEMKERFAETFQTIQQHFSNTFKQLFGGGTAELKLEQKNEFLTSGIEIFTQPPGKKIQNLSLLSGGERALTAIALLFAILKTKSVPFCILDEVEAALDEANVDRFAKFLKTFSTQTQFIVVTHRKGTMEVADVLYGVTMEEAGISKILSVKLQDADKYLDT